MDPVHVTRLKGSNDLAALTLDGCQVQIPVISLAQDEDKSLPHVSECNFCYDCVVTPTPPSALHHQHYSTGTGSRRSYRRLQRGQQTQQQQQQQRHAHRLGRHRLLTGTGGTGSINLQFSRSHGADALSSSSSSSSGLGPAFEWDGLSVGKRGARRTWEAMRGPSLIKYAASAVAAGIAGVVSDPNRVLPELLEPGDAINKIFKPNCTRCRGCTAQLYDMQTAEPAEGEGAGTGSNFPQFQHSVGTTPTWQFFARVPMSASRFVIKVGTAWCPSAIADFWAFSLLGCSMLRGGAARCTWAREGHACRGTHWCICGTVAFQQQMHNRVLPAGASRRSAR